MKLRNIVFASVLMAFLASSMAFASCGLYCPGKCCKVEKPAKKVNVLFMVGGWEGHDPVNLPNMLKKALEDTGSFIITITQDHDQFKAENVGKYDVVMDYTTGGELTKEQEAGLTQFVSNGKGFVGIHSATDSFKNSDAYWQMVGGRFTGHGHEKFDVKITGKRNANMKTLKDFSITDETYKHAFHPKSKLIVLARRVKDGDPSAWIQYYGKGRVFVTGLGHGKEAWENPSFQKMIRNGILWANQTLNP